MPHTNLSVHSLFVAVGCMLFYCISWQQNHRRNTRRHRSTEFHKTCSKTNVALPVSLSLDGPFICLVTITRKLCCRKDDRAMRPIYGCPEYWGLPDYAHGYYSQHFSRSFVPIDPVNVPPKFEVCSFTNSWDNRGYSKNLDSPWIRPRSIFS